MVVQAPVAELLEATVRALAPTRATALASALSDYRGWNLYPHCAQCRVLRLFPVKRLTLRPQRRLPPSLDALLHAAADLPGEAFRLPHDPTARL
jgi:hypothetical protein